MRSLDHRVPPPALALALAGFMWGLSHVLPGVAVPTSLRVALTVAIAVAGLSFRINSLHSRCQSR